MNSDLPAIQYINLTYEKYQFSGTFTSQFFVSESIANWKVIEWNSTLPIGTGIKFQLRSATSLGELSDEEFCGPDGGSNSYYTTSGSIIYKGHDSSNGIQYKAYFSTLDTSHSPTLNNVKIIYNNPPSIEIQTPVDEQYGDITFNYILYDHDDISDMCDILVYYRGVNGEYYPATSGVGGDGTTQLSSSSKGILHTFVWSSDADLDGIDYDYADIKITPIDTDYGLTDKSNRFQVDNNDPPIISSVITKGNCGNIEIIFNLNDNESDVCDLTLEYQGGSSGNRWTKATIEESSNKILPGIKQKIIWDSKADEPDQMANDYKIRLIPCDNDTGFGAESELFKIDNKHPSIISVSPDYGEKYVETDTEIIITFDEPMEKPNIENSFFITPSINIRFTWDGAILIVIPEDDLLYETQYSISIDTMATDIFGNPLKNKYESYFKTESKGDEDIDTDGDNIPNNIDDDDDNDEYLDEWEFYLNTNALDPNDYPDDTDNDGKPDGNKRNSQSWMDKDDDNDGLDDKDELIMGTDPLNADTDNDGHNDDVDYYPLDGTKWKYESEPQDNNGIIFFIIILIIISLTIIYFFGLKPNWEKRKYN
jgi:hypothetical protein